MYSSFYATAGVASTSGSGSGSNNQNNNNNNGRGASNSSTSAGNASPGGFRSHDNGIPVYPGGHQQEHQMHDQQLGHQLQQQLRNADNVQVEDGEVPVAKASAGGRPRDKVWDLFDGNRDLAKCRHCSWKTDHPKAFRMRAHVVSCNGIPDDKKQQLEVWQAAKEGKRALKEEGDVANKKVKREKDTGAFKTMPGARSPITCHVLDSTSGKPAPDMRIRLDRLNTSGFALLASGVTDHDGRCSTLLSAGSKLDVGIFKITFFTSEYFTKRGILSFYPFVEIPFEVKTAEEHYHIPLLLSPYAYSTYRGS